MRRAALLLGVAATALVVVPDPWLVDVVRTVRYTLHGRVLAGLAAVVLARLLSRRQLQAWSEAALMAAIVVAEFVAPKLAAGGELSAGLVKQAVFTAAIVAWLGRRALMRRVL